MANLVVIGASKGASDIIYQGLITLGVMTPFWITLVSLMRKSKQAADSNVVTVAQIAERQQDIYQAVNQVVEDETIPDDGTPTKPTLGSLLRQVDKKIDSVRDRIDQLESRVDRIDAKVDKGFRENSLAHGEMYGRVLNLESKLAKEKQDQ